MHQHTIVFVIIKKEIYFLARHGIIIVLGTFSNGGDSSEKWYLLYRGKLKKKSWSFKMKLKFCQSSQWTVASRLEKKWVKQWCFGVWEMWIVPQSLPFIGCAALGLLEPLFGHLSPPTNRGLGYQKMCWWKPTFHNNSKCFPIMGITWY